MRFCELAKESWFLSPYVSDNDLRSAPREIQRCSRFRVCPSIPFTVRAHSVPQRRVRIWKKDETEPEDITRSYCSLDAARCGSFGYMVQSTPAGIDCSDAAKHTKCRVDRLTSPLISIVFGDGGESNTVSIQKKLDELRVHCPYAFMESIKGSEGITLFSNIRDRLTTEYDSTQIVGKKEVHEWTNALVFAVFGLGQNRGTRGLNGKYTQESTVSDTQLDAYIKQGRCARYVAQRMKEQQIEYSKITGLEYEIGANDYTSPGTSLYLFANRVTIFVPMRWWMQCVVWADSGQIEGGVDADFVKEVVDGNIVNVLGNAQCNNWKESLDDKNMGREMTLKRRLLTSKNIFTVTENEEFSFGDRQIVKDLHTAVAWALHQIGARDRPDLWCLENDPLETETPINKVDFAKVHRIRSPFKDFNMDSTVSEYDTFAENQGVPDMNSRVRKFIFGEKNVGDVLKLTHAELFTKELLMKRSENLDGQVTGTDIRWPMYEFTALKLENIIEKNEPTHPTWAEYVTAAGTKTNHCTEDQKILKSPEYLLSGSALRTCTDPQNDLFTCDILRDYVINYNDRSNHPPLFLRSDELLVLVLYLVKRAMYNSHMGGFGDLHIPHARETGGWDAILDLFRDVSDNAGMEVEDPLRLAKSNNVEVWMKTLSESGVECSADNEIHEGLNQQHIQLRECYEDLREEVGWVVEAKTLVTQTLDIPVKAAMLLQGFYPAFEQVSRHDEADTDPGEEFRADHFLRDLFSGNPGEKRTGETICFANENSGGGEVDETKLVTEMNPFWGEFFDVAPSGGSAKGHLSKATGCDMKRSGPENSILVFSTLCASTPSAVQDCEDHPNYLKQLREILPPECEGLDGNRVHRDIIGAVEGTPLCERRPRLRDNECRMAHGLLHGRRGTAVGTRVSDLDTVNYMDMENTQSGLWNRSNSLFRADQADSLSEDATALQLKGTDIGGTRLAFRVSAGGVLRLESASMRSDPGKTQVPDVREWLAHVEDNFADQQRKYEFVNAVTENGGSSWRCPLHWMQTFVSAGNVLDQARAPVSTRNAARFEHITGVANRYAHPTMRSSAKIERLHAARFLSDGLACVGQGQECHGKAHLKESVSALLEARWRTVEYVGIDSCSRVLDWPEEKVNRRF